MHLIRPKTVTQRWQGCITFRGRDLLVHAEIIPGRAMPHVSVDSPDPDWQKAEAASIYSYSLYDADVSAIWSTGELWQHRYEIRALILAAWSAERVEMLR